MKLLQIIKKTRFNIVPSFSIFILIISSIITAFTLYIILNIALYFINNLNLAINFSYINSVFIVISLTCLFFIVYKYNDFYKHITELGIQFRIKIFTFFLLIGLLSFIPQAYLSYFFIKKTTELRNDFAFNKALFSAFQFIESYYDEQKNFLKNILEHENFIPLIKANPINIYNIITESPNFSKLDFLEIFNERGELVFIWGPSEYTTNYNFIKNLEVSLLDFKTTQKDELLKGVYFAPTKNGFYTIIIGKFISKDFNTAALDVYAGINTYNELLEYGKRFERIALLGYFILALPLFFITLIFGLFISKITIIPLKSFEQALLKVSQGSYDFILDEDVRHDFYHIMKSFNSMLQEIQDNKKRIIQTEQILTWQKIAEQLAHEIKNPLTPIKLSAQRIQYKMNKIDSWEDPIDQTSQFINKSAEIILNEVERISFLLTQFKDFAHLPKPEKAFVSIASIFYELKEIYENSYPYIKIIIQPDQNYVLNADKEQLHQAFRNIIKNAIESIIDEGVIEIIIYKEKKLDKDKIHIYCNDTGSGIPLIYQKNIFNPYMTTKKEGTGLGLAIVQKILNNHEGTIELVKSTKEGTSFHIVFDILKKI